MNLLAHESIGTCTPAEDKQQESLGNHAHKVSHCEAEKPRWVTFLLNFSTKLTRDVQTIK